MIGRYHLLRGLLGVGLLSVIVSATQAQAPAGQPLPAISGQPNVGQPVAGQPIASQPVAGQPVGGQPIAQPGQGQPATLPQPASVPGATQVAQPGGAVKAAAVVNGHVITQTDLDTVLKSAGPSPVQIPETTVKQMKMQALAMMIDNVLMDQYLKVNGPAVAPAEVEKKLAEFDAGLKKQNKTIADFCRETGQDEGQLRLNITRMIQWHNFANARITEKDVKAYYDGYKDFFDGVTVKASHIVLRIAPQAPEAEKAAARQKLSEIRAQILAGKIAFADAAKQHSQCPSAPKGGDIGFIPRKWMVEEAFARAAFALQPNQITDIVQTDYGYHVILVTERKPGQPSEYEKIKDAVREFCIEELHQAVLAQQRKVSKVEINLP